ncbi:hypothetical protein BDR05DRAFT_433766 [Suillus weaverae]|nr:hypothetical protein BDR05DRAFT_433766 [Suillus weaverae]
MVLMDVWTFLSIGKEHEFLLLHFCHPMQQDALAILVSDRIPSMDPADDNNNNSSSRHMQSSCIVSPSVAPTTARDGISTTSNSASTIESYLSRTYDRFKRCSVLEFTSTHPSARQVSVLLSIINKHSPVYHLYRYQCYWYAHTFWEAFKRLFPNCFAEKRVQGTRLILASR